LYHQRAGEHRPISFPKVFSGCVVPKKSCRPVSWTPDHRFDHAEDILIDGTTRWKVRWESDQTGRHEKAFSPTSTQALGYVCNGFIGDARVVSRNVAKA